jgi:hypothetical protein
MRQMNYLQAAVAALAIAMPAVAAAEPQLERKSRDVCVVDVASGFPLNFFVFRDVAPLVLNEPVSLTGMYFVRSRLPAPAHGTAVLVSDGTVRMGFFVQSTAVPTAEPNDFTISGTVDSNLAGVVFFDNDGDFRPNGTLDLRATDCNTVVIP